MATRGKITLVPCEKEVTNSGTSLVGSSTASLAESIVDYRRIQGRTFTKKTEYWYETITIGRFLEEYLAYSG